MVLEKVAWQRGQGQRQKQMQRGLHRQQQVACLKGFVCWWWPMPVRGPGSGPGHGQGMRQRRLRKQLLVAWLGHELVAWKWQMQMKMQMQQPCAWKMHGHQLVAWKCQMQMQMQMQQP